MAADERLADQSRFRTGSHDRSASGSGDCGSFLAGRVRADLGAYCRRVPLRPGSSTRRGDLLHAPVGIYDLGRSVGMNHHHAAVVQQSPPLALLQYVEMTLTGPLFPPRAVIRPEVQRAFHDMASYAR